MFARVGLYRRIFVRDELNRRMFERELGSVLALSSM